METSIYKQLIESITDHKALCWQISQIDNCWEWGKCCRGKAEEKKKAFRLQQEKNAVKERAHFVWKKNI